MSGPKVVRIVTREERIATCKGHLARLDEAVAAWQRKCETRGLASAGDVEAMLRQAASIRELLMKDKFLELQKRAPVEIEFLHSDLEKRLQQAAEAHARALTARRRLSSAASTLLGSLAKSGVEVPSQLAEDLAAAKDSARDGVAAAESAISNGLSLLLPNAESGGLNERQREIARRLGEGEETETLVAWLGGDQPPDDVRAKEIDRHIAELETVEGENAARPFLERAAKIAARSSSKQRALLADSLLFDIVQHVKSRREKEEALSTLSEMLAEYVKTVEQADNALVERTEQALRSQNVEQVGALLQELQAAIDTSRKANAAEARRAAILNALSGLGYEVREGMQTAWAENGNVTLRNASQPGFGVKVSGGKTDGPVQFRAVSFGRRAAVRDAARDKDMELRWCGDFDRLREHLRHAGSEMSVEKAIAAGDVALEIIEEAEEDLRREPVTKRPTARQV